MTRATKLTLSLLIVLTALPLAGAELRNRADAFGADQVLERLALKPTADSELTLGDAVVVDLADGTRRLRVAQEVGDREERFFFKVDLEARTYTAWRADSAAIPEHVRKRAGERARTRNRLNVGTEDIYYDPPPDCGAPTGPQPCDAPCQGNSNAVLTAYDASWNWLADTEGNLKYRRLGANGCRWFAYMEGHCWANNNAGGKIWSTQSCNIVNGPPVLDGAWGSIEGKYYNTNGGNVNLRTDIRHFLRIDYAAPATWVFYEYNFTGEMYTTFYIEFFSWVNGYCSPY